MFKCMTSHCCGLLVLTTYQTASHSFIYVPMSISPHSSLFSASVLWKCALLPLKVWILLVSQTQSPQIAFSSFGLAPQTLVPQAHNIHIQVAVKTQSAGKRLLNSLQLPLLQSSSSLLLYVTQVTFTIRFCFHFETLVSPLVSSPSSWDQHPFSQSFLRVCWNISSEFGFSHSFHSPPLFSGW